MKSVTPLAAAAMILCCTASHAQWIINEINADPDTALGDANGDGTPNFSEDEFVEIVNNTGAAVDIGNWTLSDGFSVRHTFAAPTMVNDGQAVVVFGGGAPTGGFGGSVVVVALSGALGLNNGGDTVTLADDLGATVVTETYGGAGGNDQSLTRDPDLYGSFVPHSTALGSGGTLFSPGTRVDGAAFGSVTALTVALTQSVLFEDAPAGVGLHTGTVLRSGDTTNPLTVTLTSLNPGALVVDASVEIPAGAFSATFEYDPAGDISGSVQTSIEATATGYDSGSADVKVLDDEAATPDVVINELLYRTAGAARQFLELYNNSGGPVDIQGWSVVSYRGDTSPSGVIGATVTIPTGSPVTIPDQGFYLIGNADFQGTFGVTPDLLAGLGSGLGSATFAVFDASCNLVYSASGTDGAGEANLGGSIFTDGSFTLFAPDLEFGPDGTFNPAGFRFAADGGGYSELLEFTPQPSPSATPGVTNVLPPELVLSVDGSLIPEDGGSMAAVGTVSRRYAEPSLPVTVTLTDDDADDSEITIPTTVEIPAGQTSVTFDIGALTDGVVDGVQTVTITATDGGGTYAPAQASIGVTDIDSPQFSDLVINEVDADTPFLTSPRTNDDAEFIELYNLTGSTQPLDGLVLVLFNGNGDSAYRSIDLTGQVIPANGYFVIGNAANVANVDLDFVTDLGLPSNNVIQNGADAVALFIATSADIPVGTTVADAVAGFTLVDALVYGTNDADDTGLLSALGQSVQYNESANGMGDTESNARNGDGGSGFLAGTPTPGSMNPFTPPPAADLAITAIEILPGGTVQIDFVGAPSSPHALKASTDLQDGFPIEVSPTGGSLVTDANGDGMVQFSFVPGEFYFRLEELGIAF